MDGKVSHKIDDYLGEENLQENVKAKVGYLRFFSAAQFRRKWTSKCKNSISLSFGSSIIIRENINIKERNLCA